MWQSYSVFLDSYGQSVCVGLTTKRTATGYNSFFNRACTHGSTTTYYYYSKPYNLVAYAGILNHGANRALGWGSLRATGTE